MATFGVLAFVAIVAIVATVAVLGHRPSGRPGTTGVITDPTSGPASSSESAGPDAPLRAALVAWSTANLSRAAVVIADPTTTAQLRAAGFGQVKADDALLGLDWRRVDYVITMPKAGTKSQVRQQLSRASAAVAIFGPESARAMISQVFAGGVAELTSRRAADESARRLAGEQLARNSAIKLDPDARGVLSGGRLDLRAASVLVLLAQHTTVHLRNAVVDPAEATAGGAPRTFTVTVDDPVFADSALAVLPESFRPATITRVSQATYILIWPPSIAPMIAIH